jgi:N-methylhydantoinase A/oxoprolinase/acetone carboxylase beta subunit
VVQGPAVIEEAMSTLLLPPGATATVEAAGNILVTRPPPSAA